MLPSTKQSDWHVTGTPQTIYSTVKAPNHEVLFEPLKCPSLLFLRHLDSSGYPLDAHR